MRRRQIQEQVHRRGTIETTVEPLPDPVDVSDIIEATDLVIEHIDEALE